MTLRTFWLRITGVPPCQQCGRCCAPSTFGGPLETFQNYVDTKALDRACMTTFTRLHVLQDDGEHLKMIGTGRCIALKGDVGELVSCSIYDERPATCRRFVPGGQQCRFVLARARVPRQERKGRCWEWYPWWKPWWVRCGPAGWRQEARYHWWCLKSWWRGEKDDEEIILKEKD